MKKEVFVQVSTKQLLEIEQEAFILGQVDMLFEIAMDMAKRKYYHKEKWDSQKVIDCHLNFCLGRLGHTLSDIDYELWCMMALIMGVK